MDSSNFATHLMPYENCIVAFRFRMQNPLLEEDRAKRCERIISDNHDFSFGFIKDDAIAVFSGVYLDDDTDNIIIDSKSKLNHFKIMKLASSDEIDALKKAVFNDKIRICHGYKHLYMNKELIDDWAHGLHEFSVNKSISEIEAGCHKTVDISWREVKAESENKSLRLRIIFSAIISHRNQKSMISIVPKEVRNYILSFILKLK